MRNITLSGNALWGSLFPSVAPETWFTFGRTVVITGAFIRRYDISSQTVTVNLYLKHFTSASATGTVFGTGTIPMTVSLNDLYSYISCVVTSKTFISSDILGLAPSLGAVSGVGSYDLIVRYKEK